MHALAKLRYWPHYVCGRYEGVDERIKALDMEISIGDYILPGGEAASCS